MSEPTQPLYAHLRANFHHASFVNGGTTQPFSDMGQFQTSASVSVRSAHLPTTDM
jgi:hypothetical protein